MIIKLKSLSLRRFKSEESFAVAGLDSFYFLYRELFFFNSGAGGL
jgi:hypothetical protein